MLILLNQCFVAIHLLIKQIHWRKKIEKKWKIKSDKNIVSISYYKYCIVYFVHVLFVVQWINKVISTMLIIHYLSTIDN